MIRKTASARMSIPPSQEEIAVRAYELFLARGGEPGRDLEDWLEAERQLTQLRPQTVRVSRDAVPAGDRAPLAASGR